MADYLAVTFGLDISHHQDLSLDLAAALRDGCQFVFMKAGEGGGSAGLVDEHFAANLAEARATGQLVAAYWFVRANATPAEHVALLRQTVPLDVAVIPDVETAADGTKPTLAQARAVLDAIRAAGFRVPMAYVPLWYWRDVWGSPQLDGWPPLWSSRYPDMVVGTLASEWADVPDTYWDGYGGLDVLVLQFSSSTDIAGYQPLDADAFRGTFLELAALLGGSTTTPASPQFGEDYDMQPITYGPVPVITNPDGTKTQVLRDSIQWDGRPAVCNIIAKDDQKPVFVAQLGCWGPRGGTSGGKPIAGNNLPGAGPNSWRVDPNLPGAFEIPPGTTRIYVSISSNGRTGLQVVPTS